MEFIVCAEPKPPAAQVTWMGGFTFVNTVNGDPQDNTNWQWVGPTADFVEPASGVVCVTAAPKGTATATTDASVWVAIDVPVDPDYYNESTDVCDKPRPRTQGSNETNPNQTYPSLRW